jgi:hypothetical protein
MAGNDKGDYLFQIPSCYFKYLKKLAQQKSHNFQRHGFARLQDATMPRKLTLAVMLQVAGSNVGWNNYYPN